MFKYKYEAKFLIDLKNGSTEEAEVSFILNVPKDTERSLDEIKDEVDKEVVSGIATHENIVLARCIDSGLFLEEKNE